MTSLKHLLIAVKYPIFTSIWTILSPTAKERRAFWSAFYSASSVGDGTRTGDRSATLFLILQVLKTAQSPLTEQQVRSALFHGMVFRKKPSSVTQEFIVHWHRWICLQVRQAQRLALESLLGWLERYLKYHQIHDTSAVANYVDELWRANPSILAHDAAVSQVYSGLTSENLHTLLQRSSKDGSFSLFTLMDEVSKRFNLDDDVLVIYALRILFLSAEYTRILDDGETIKGDLNLGGPDRISLKFWLDSVTRSSRLKPREFILLVLEQFVVSQHLAVAARRYDGATQRLRLSIEEEGLTVLADGDLPLRVTPDRLFTALSLMAECKIIDVDTRSRTFSAKLT